MTMTDFELEPWTSDSLLPDPRYSQSLERGLGILACFTPTCRVWGVKEIADQIGLSSSTTHRYVVTLAELGYLVRVSPGRKYSLTLGVTQLGLSAMSGTSLREHAAVDVHELSRRTGFAVGIGVLDGPEVLLLEWVAGRRRQIEAERGMAAGVTLPAYCTALGKLLLASLPARMLRALLGQVVVSRRTANTIISKRALKEELAGVREAGFGMEDEEFSRGAVGMAVPVRASDGEAVAAIGMLASTRTIRLQDLVNALGPHLVAAADRVSARLGFRRPDELLDGLVRSASPTSNSKSKW